MCCSQSCLRNTDRFPFCPQNQVTSKTRLGFYSLILKKSQLCMIHKKYSELIMICRGRWMETKEWPCSEKSGSWAPPGGGGRYCHFVVTVAEEAASVLIALLDVPSPLQCPNTSSKPPSPKSPSQVYPFASGHPPLALIFKELYLLNAIYDTTPWWSPSTIFHYRMVLLLVALWDQPEKCNYPGRVYLA